MKNLFETVRAMYAPKQIAEGNDGNLANNAPPFDKVTKGDVIAGRLGKDAMGGKKKKVGEEDLSHQARTTMKHIPNASPALKKAAKDIKPGIAGYKDRIDMLKAGGVKEDITLGDVDVTVMHKLVEFEVNLAEKDYKTYFQTAMKGKDLGNMSPEEKKKFFNKVDDGYKAKNEAVFLEAMFDSHINDVIAAHKKAGNHISDEKSAMSDGKMRHSYVVTTPEGKRTRHIHHGSTKKVETMSPKAKSALAKSMDDENDK